MEELKLFLVSAGRIQVGIFADSIKNADLEIIKRFDVKSIKELLAGEGYMYWVHIESYPVKKGIAFYNKNI